MVLTVLSHTVERALPHRSVLLDPIRTYMLIQSITHWSTVSNAPGPLITAISNTRAKNLRGGLGEVRGGWEGWHFEMEQRPGADTS